VLRLSASLPAGDGTPRSLRKGSGSGSSSSSGGPVSHLLSLTSTTSLPPAYEDDTAPAALGARSGRLHGAALRRASSGLRGLLPSPLQSLAAAFGDTSEASLLSAPSFAQAAESFERARCSGWGGNEQQQQQPSGAAAEHPEHQQHQELVRLLFARYDPSSSNYSGLDVEVVLRLSTLVFYCNRPTVAALMVLGTDLSAINTLLAAPADEATQVRRCVACCQLWCACGCTRQLADSSSNGDVPAAGAQDGGDDAAPDSSTTDSDSVSDVQLIKSGGEERTLFKLTLQV
jgi:hypothetical protein